MKAYFIAILTLFTCMATVVRAQQMSELENRIDSLLNGKKATVGIAVWTDKGDMLRYNDHVHFPLLSVFKFHVALAVLDKMDKQSISLDSIVSIKASQMLPNTYSPLRKKLPDQDFTITLRELMQYSISQSDNNACDILIEYAGGIKHAGWVSTPSTSRKQKTTCTPASRLYTATGVLLPLWPDY